MDETNKLWKDKKVLRDTVSKKRNAPQINELRLIYLQGRGSVYNPKWKSEGSGRFPQGLTPENIKSVHKSQPYNQLIAEVLYKTSWLESWGTGVQRMCDVCKEENVPEPYYVTEQGYVTIVFKKGASATGDCGSDCGIQLTERQQEILRMVIKDCGTSAKQIAEALHISVRTTSTEIAVLRKNGFIDKENKDNKSPWVVLKNPSEEK